MRVGRLTVAARVICSPWDAAKASPALSVRVAAGEMDIAASRRDLLGAIAPAGSERDGLAPPSKIAEDMGRISTRKRSGFLAYVLCSNLHHQA